MKNIVLANDYIPGVSSLTGAILSAALVGISLGIAAWALQSANWISTNPPFVLILILGVMLSTGLALKRVRQAWAIPIFIFTGLLASVWQSIIALPKVAGLNIWSEWLEGLSKPASDPTLFIILLVMITWLIGAFGAWYAVRRRNGWVTFVLGSSLLILNIINLPRDFINILPLFLALALATIIQTNWLKSHNKTNKSFSRTPIVPGLALCLIVVLGAFVLPSSPAENLKLDIDGGALYSSIKNNGLNIFQAVPSKVRTILSSSQETVTFVGAPDLGETVRFRVSNSTNGYFATRYYDVYSASGWSSSPLIDGNLPANQSIGDAVPASKASLVRYDVENEIKTDLILINGRPDAVSLPTTSRSLTAPSGIDLSSLVSVKVLAAYATYTVNTRITTATASDLAKANSAYPEWITERYLQLPSSLPRSIKTLSQQLTKGLTTGTMGSSTYNKVVAIENYLQNFSYDIDGSFISGNTDGVAAFLSDRQGNCVNFASALVVMLRSVGVPARFVQGYLGSEIDSNGKDLLIYGRDAHAWAEVYFPDYGWIIAEATPGKPSDNFSGISPTNPGEIIPPDTETAPIPGNDNSTGSPGTPSGQSSGVSLQWILIGLLAGLVVAFSGGIMYITRATTPEMMYSRLGGLGRLFHEPPTPFDTPAEYARRLGLRVPLEAGDISLIANAFAHSRYGQNKANEVAERIALSRTWKSLSYKLIGHRLGIGNSE